ncbi:MAG: hypothetical protein PHY29_02980 [Syntrophales bacterium]|nr:hypothetical protein [Syntrophales bacterium]
MNWNYRVVRHELKGEVWFAIHEVYYNKSGEVCAMTKEPDPPVGDTIEELKTDITQMLSALDAPILEHNMEFAKSPWSDAIQKGKVREKR